MAIEDVGSEPHDGRADRLRDRLCLPRPPWIVGHRGAAAEALENTLPSFRLAVAQRVDMIEADVQLTADGGLVILHDTDLRRLAGVKGQSEASTLDDLRVLELRDDAGKRGRIPTLAELFDAVPAELPLNLELKRRRAPRRAFADAVAAATEGRQRLLLSSFDHRLLALLAERRPDLPLAPLGRRWPRRLVAASGRLGAAAIHCHRRLAYRVLERAGSLPVLVYTVNDATTGRDLLSRGAAGLFSDRPAALRAELGLAAGREAGEPAC